MAGKTLPVTGGCLCGAIRYESTAPPNWVSYCHCRICQKAYGALFGLFAAFPEAAFRYTRGAPKYYRSSPRARRGFCRDCGSPVDFRYDDRRERGVLIGTLDRPEEWPADRRHNGIESEVPWLVIDDGLPRVRADDS